MSDKGSFLFTFVIGAGIGSVCTWQLLKKKYELLAQEEIDSVKETYASREAGKQFFKESYEGIKSVENPNHDENEDIEKCNSIIRQEGYVDYSRGVAVSFGDEKKKGDPFVEKPYVITPEEFGEFEEYEKISLTCYADRVLADENDEEVDDVDDIVGEESLNHFGEYEDDSVFVRNDRLKCDYEILLDQRNYSDVVKKMPH